MKAEPTKPKHLHILHIIDSAMVGGGQQHLFLLLRELDPDQHQLEAACSGIGPLIPRLNSIGIPVHTLSQSNRIGIRGFFKLILLLRHKHFHVVHCHGTRAGFWGRLAARITRVPLTLYTLHGIHYLNYSNPLKRYGQLMIDRLLSYITDHTICVSESDLKKAKRWNIVRPGYCSAITNGIDPKIFLAKNQDNHTRRLLDIPPNRPVIGMVARLHPQKGYPVLIDALQQVREEIPEILLLIVGDGPQKKELERQVRHLKLQNHVRFLGTRSDIPELLSLLDILVLSSRWEGLPLILLEAFAAGCPVIATAVDGVRDLVVHRENGLLVPARDAGALAKAIVEVFARPSEATHRAEQARETITGRYSSSVMGKAVADLYASLAAMVGVPIDCWQRPRIGIDVRKLTDYGIGTYIQNLLLHLSRIDHQNDYVLYIQPEDMHRSWVQAENLIPVPESAPKYSIRELITLALKMKRTRIDLFHSPHYVLPPLRPCPAVVTVHDIIHLLFPEYLPSRPAYHYARLMLYIAIRMSRRVITVSESSKQDILRICQVPAEKIVVAYNAIDSIFHPRPQEEVRSYLREEFKIVRPYLLYVGSSHPHKNLIRLLFAFSRLRIRYPELATELEFITVGAAFKNGNPFTETLERLNLKPHIRHLGVISRTALAQVYCGAEIFVFPSLYEGFGLPPVEAMACGTPVVAGRNPSLTEIIGDAGLLVDPYDIDELAEGIARILENPELQAAMRERGFACSRRYSWEKAAKQTLATYHSILAEQEGKA